MIGEDDIRRVRDATDIVELIGERVVLKQRGREFWGNCPFHNEKTPSFKVDPASQFYHCFGCGEGGDVFKYTMKTENIDFPDAVRALAQRKNIELTEERGSVGHGKKARLFAVCEETAIFYHQQLMRVKSTQSDAAREYLARRGMGGSIPNEWRLGFAPGNGLLVQYLMKKGFLRDELVGANVAYYSEGSRQLRDRFFNRIMFPIADLQGRTIAFGGRVIGAGEPKYLNSSGTLLFQKRDNLFAIDKAKSSVTAKGLAVVVEGYTDVISMHHEGFTNTVATLGTALTPEHLKLLSRFTQRVVLLFDGDDAGLRAADRAADLINVVAAPEIGRKTDIYVAVLPGKMDPADFCAAEGSEAMQVIIDHAVPLLRFVLDRRLSAWDLSKPEQRIRALEDAVRVLVPVKGTLLAADYINHLADVFAVDYAVVAGALDKAKPLPVFRESSSNAQNVPVVEGNVGSQGAATQQAVALGQAAHSATRQHLQSLLNPVLGRTSAMERELLYLFIEHPEVRQRLSEAFRRITWSREEHQCIGDVLLSLGSDGESEVVMAQLIARIPDAASQLSGVRLPEFADIPAHRLATILMFNIRESQLKQAIRTENALLRRAGEEQPAQVEELFEHLAQLQKELQELRVKYQDERSQLL